MNFPLNNVIMQCFFNNSIFYDLVFHRNTIYFYYLTWNTISIRGNDYILSECRKCCH